MSHQPELLNYGRSELRGALGPYSPASLGSAHWQSVGMTSSHTGIRGRAGARVQTAPLLTGDSRSGTPWATPRPRGRGHFRAHSHGVHALRCVKRGLVTERAVRPRLPNAAWSPAPACHSLIRRFPAHVKEGRREEGTGLRYNPNRLPNRLGCWVTGMRQCVGERSAL